MPSEPDREEMEAEEGASGQNRKDENCNLSTLSKAELVKLVSEGVKLSLLTQEEIDNENFLRVVIRRVQYEIKNQEQRSQEMGEQMQAWKEEENIWKCLACEKFSASPNVPKNLRKWRRGQFGAVNKSSQRNEKINAGIRKHNDSALHKWCFKIWKEEKEKAKEKDDKEKKAATDLVRNGLYCLKKVTGSSTMLVELQSMSFSSGGLTATKNDSKQMYFTIREIAERKLREKIRSIFKNVRVFAISLDKVTLDGETFTPVIVFFFNEGVLEHIMAELFVNSSGIFRVTGDI